MIDDLLKRADTLVAKPYRSVHTIDAQCCIRDLAARVRELEAERDALRESNERLRGLLRQVRDWPYPSRPYTMLRRIDAALADGEKT